MKNNLMFADCCATCKFVKEYNSYGSLTRYFCNEDNSCKDFYYNTDNSYNAEQLIELSEWSCIHQVEGYEICEDYEMKIFKWSI